MSTTDTSNTYLINGQEITLVPKGREPRQVNVTRRGCQVTITRGTTSKTVTIKPAARAKALADDIKADSDRGRMAADFLLAPTREAAEVALAQFNAKYGVA